jgi:hypothetical protein
VTPWVGIWGPSPEAVVFLISGCCQFRESYGYPMFAPWAPAQVNRKKCIVFAIAIATKLGQLSIAHPLPSGAQLLGMLN